MKLDDDIEMTIEEQMDSKPMECVALDKSGKAVRSGDAAGR